MGQKYIIMCRSLTYAQRASKALERSGISSAITKAPQGVTVSGCSFGVRVQGKHVKNALETVKKSGITVGKIFSLDESGRASEVTL